MPDSYTLQCRCGAVEGKVHSLTPSHTNRVICYCTYCQAYMHYLGMQEQVLDKEGGSDIFQISPKHLEFTKGTEHIQCVTQTSKGALRWHADCCKTPLGNTFQKVHIPFIGLHPICIPKLREASNRDVILGPIRARVNGTFPKHKRPPKTGGFALFKMLFRYAPMFFTWWIRGDGKHSPLLQPATHEPISKPKRIHIRDYYPL